MAGPWRRGLLRPGLIVAVAVCVGLLAIHVVPLLIHMSDNADMAKYGEAQFNFHAGLGERLNSLAHLAWSFIIFGLPFLIVLGIVAWRGDVSVAKERHEGGFTIIAAALALVALSLLGLIFGAGLMYRPRFGNPVMPLILLVLLGCVDFSSEGIRRFTGGVLIFYAIITGGSVFLLTGFGDNYLRDPLAVATDRIREDWHSHYTCGPAYIVGGNEIGNAPAAQGVGMYYGGTTIGLSDRDYRFSQWVDHDRLRDLGAIILETPRSMASSTTSALFPDTTPQLQLKLPFRRSFGNQTQTYLYRFVAPKHCP